MADVPSSPTPYGAREYYSPVAEPHYIWFDEPTDERRFVASERCRSEGWQQAEMWCCCACIADLPVAVPIGSELVKNFNHGDVVLAGSVRKGGGGGVSVEWNEAKVEYAGKLPSGDIDPGDTKSVLINYGKGQQAIVAGYQYLMTSEGKLKQALGLSLSDRLVAKDGSSVSINSIKSGEFDGPRYHLGTSKGFSGSTDGHLLCLNDIVAADYVLQKHRDELPKEAVG